MAEKANGTGKERRDEYEANPLIRPAQGRPHPCPCLHKSTTSKNGLDREDMVEPDCSLVES